MLTRGEKSKGKAGKSTLSDAKVQLDPNNAWIAISHRIVTEYVKIVKTDQGGCVIHPKSTIKKPFSVVYSSGENTNVSLDVLNETNTAMNNKASAGGSRSKDHDTMALINWKKVKGN